MSVFNRTKLLTLVNNDEVFLQELINDYLEDTSKKITALNEAIEEKDTHTTKFIAHSLNGTSGIMTAIELQQAARQLENAAKIGDFILGAYYLNKIEIELDKIKEHLINS